MTASRDTVFQSLRSHLRTIEPVHMRDLFARDRNRFAAFSARHEDMLLDYSKNRVTAETMETLYLRAHDLKGLGTTYEFPLITRIGASLCRLIDDKDKRLTVSLPLVDAHIDAIKAAVRDSIKTDDHPVGRILIEELERKVAAAA